MKTAVRLGLFLIFSGALHTTAAQTQTPFPVVPKLPETAFQSVSSHTLVPSSNGVRFQYQMVHLYNDEAVFLSPAWQGRTKLEPPKRGLFTPYVPDALNSLLIQTLNELSAAGWEIVDIQSSVQPVGAKQQIETDLAYNDPQRPAYTAKTSIETLTQTRYLLRKPLAR
ncbi:hypothetical protein [Hymenobacter sp. BT730]|uniref:hypothetical protein n=1 Tax=Hymenobacter sp. BT730 TaxID=3063332 RepID=UPI0026E0FA9B|nr:hypothetical protein [Hymenobacter sp. BT730]